MKGCRKLWISNNKLKKLRVDRKKMIYIREVLLLLKKYVLQLIKILYIFIKYFIKKIIVEYKQNKYINICRLYLILNVIIFITLKYEKSSILSIVRIVHSVIQSMLVILILFKLISNKKKNYIEYLKSMENWDAAAMVVSFLDSIYFRQASATLSIIFIYIGNLIFFMMIYHKYRLVVHEKVINWWKYTVYFLSLPILAMLSWLLIGLFISEVFTSYMFISSNFVKFMTIIITILIFNVEIYFTPKERIDEVRVAVYLVLAIFSTISYCFFISDYLAQVVSESSNFTKESIRNLIDIAIKWVSLPYLIGSVFGCFVLELVNRNINIGKR